MEPGKEVETVLPLLSPIISRRINSKSFKQYCSQLVSSANASKQTRSVVRFTFRDTFGANTTEERRREEKHCGNL